MVEVVAPYNAEHTNPNTIVNIYWAPGSDPSAAGTVCQWGSGDRIFTFWQKAGLTCDGAPYDFGAYSLRAFSCQNTGCERYAEEIGIPFQVTKADLGCPQPKKMCNGDEKSCQNCLQDGIGIGGGPPGLNGGDGPGGKNGHGAFLNYAGGQVGRAGYPGSTEWNVTLGRYWSHEFAERIVADGSPNPEDHVWLLSQYATLKEWSGPDAGTGVYASAEPADEHRTLTWLGVGLGWELRDLDGTVDAFDDAGRWQSRTDRNGNVTEGFYDGSGILDYVTFPDGLTEDFDYDPTTGKLASITVLGVDGSSTQVWGYSWTGDDLTRVDRPDGTALVYSYDDGRFPGYLTRVTLEGTDPAITRVERAYEYDDEGNVVTTWRGDAAVDGPDATEIWHLAYDDPADPTVTTVTDPLGQESTYQLDRTDVAPNFRVTSISGSCPVCNLGPNAQLDYTDATNPSLPTSTIDGRGVTTATTYDANGQIVSRTEAVGESEARMISWTYDGTFPALVTSMEQPSVAGGSSLRTTTWTLDSANGNVTTRSLFGVEAGSALPTLDTVFSYNAAGQPLTIDPPGYGTDDVTSYTYDPSRGSLLPLTRSDPLPPSSTITTTFGYDPFNRRTSVTDPNGLETATSYDALDRVTEVRQLGPASPTDDLVTVYTFDERKDLTRITLPNQNVIEYGYDAAGRLTSIERKPDASTPGERTLYTLDAVGNRTLEEQQRWVDGSPGHWETVTSTAYDSSNRCQVDAVRQAPDTPEEAKTTFQYDCDGNLEQVWAPDRDPDADPPTTSYAYDVLNRLTTVTQDWEPAGGTPGSAVTRYGYDVQDHLVSVEDAEGNTTAYVYSDRDLLTHEQADAFATVADPSDPAICPPEPACNAGCGCTTHSYNLHGEEESWTDARGVTVGRTTDALDRVTELDFIDDTLDVHYDYDTAPGSCGSPSAPIGRLASITRDGQSIDSCYDHFGRLVQDGELGYTYDENGNRTEIVYPGGVTASYSFDFADRETGLEVTTPAGGTTPHAVASGATYLPAGPLAGLTLGNGASEIRSFDGKNAPTGIALSGLTGSLPGRSWTYATDPVGNVTEIVETADCTGGGSAVVVDPQTITTTETFRSCGDLQAGGGFSVESPGAVRFEAEGTIALADGFSVGTGASFVAGGLSELTRRTFGYQPPQDFLTSADGPWGTLDWTYDKIGNRLSESRDDGASADGYVYKANGAGGDTPILDLVNLAVVGTRDYTWDDAGNLNQVAAGANVIDFQLDQASRLAAADRTGSGGGVAAFLYDGRGFLRSAAETSGGTSSVAPLYDFAGLLHALRRQPTPTDPIDTTYVLYLAGRPVAQLAIDGAGAETWTYLTTDHLGTPLAATDEGGEITWQGGFEPFGGDWQAGTMAGASDNGIYLRLPGQWDDGTWDDCHLRGWGLLQRPPLVLNLPPAGTRGPIQPTTAPGWTSTPTPDRGRSGLSIF